MLSKSRRRPERGAGLAILAIVALVIAACSKEASNAPNASATVAAVNRDSITADSIARARQDSINRAQPGYIVDSIFTPDEEIRRFRKALGGDSATQFVGGSASRDALVRRFIDALVKSDTSDLRAMAVHAREFADLYYPRSPYAHPPYHQPPDFAWRLIQDKGRGGLTKLMKQVAGTSMRYVGNDCEPKVLYEGEVTRYSGCLVRVVMPAGDTATKRYFGSIVERKGQFKFLSYANDF